MQHYSNLPNNNISLLMIILVSCLWTIRENQKKRRDELHFYFRSKIHMHMGKPDNFQAPPDPQPFIEISVMDGPIHSLDHYLYFLKLLEKMSKPLKIKQNFHWHNNIHGARTFPLQLIFPLDFFSTTLCVLLSYANEQLFWWLAT